MSSGARRYFYNSKLWNNVRKNVWIKQNLLCGICGKPVYVDGISDYLPKEKRRTGIVHHKIWLDNNNIEDDNITINEDEWKHIQDIMMASSELEEYVGYDKLIFDKYFKYYEQYFKDR